MARIRSIKPEAFESETLAKVSVSAERTLFGLTTIVDDRGRIADKPAQINGNLWSMRGGHSTGEMEDELEQLVKADGLVCRYIGCDGRRYLHLVTWDRHQKIDHPSKVRTPRCPHHPVSATGRAEECGLHAGNCPPRESLANPREMSRGTAGVSPPLASVPAAPERSPESSQNGGGEHCASDQQESESSRESRESSRDVETYLGPRTMDLGPRTMDLPPTAGAEKPRRGKSAPSEAHVGTVVGAYVDGATASGQPAPASSLRARVGKQARQLLADGYDIAVLVEAAKHMGAGEWNDLAVQVRKDAAGANGRASPRIPTTDQRVAQAQALKAQLRAKRGGESEPPLPPNTIPGSVVQ